MKRRTAFAGIGAAVTGSLAGCVDRLRGTDLEGYVRPAEDPTVVPPALSCEEYDGDRLTAREGDWGDVERFALRVDGLDFEYGDTVTVTLTNTSSSEQYYNTDRSMYSLSVYTDSGWQDIRIHTPDHGIEHTDAENSLFPGETLEWTLTLTEDELSTREELVVCPDLVTGRYRFTYYGISDLVSVAFDLTL